MKLYWIHVVAMRFCCIISPLLLSLSLVFALIRNIINGKTIIIHINTHILHDYIPYSRFLATAAATPLWWCYRRLTVYALNWRIHNFRHIRLSRSVTHFLCAESQALLCISFFECEQSTEEKKKSVVVIGVHAHRQSTHTDWLALTPRSATFLLPPHQRELFIIIIIICGDACNNLLLSLGFTAKG